MESVKAERIPVLQKAMARFEPLKIDLNDYQIDVISDPHTLTFRQKNGIIREIRDVTKTYRPEASRKEIAFRTVHPDVSLLLLVRETKTGKAVGYFSTRTPTDDTIHLHASVFEPAHQKLAFYSFSKLLAQALERKKMQLHGRTARFVTAQSQEPDVLTKLAVHDGMWPAHLHESGVRSLKMQAIHVSQALDADAQYDTQKGIRIGGLRALGGKKRKPKPLTTNTIEAALRRLDGSKRRRLRQVLNAIDRPRGDAALVIRRIDREHEEKLKTAESLIHPHLQPLLVAELALGAHRQDIGDVRIHPDIAIHPTGQKLKLMEINVDAGRVNWDGLNADLQKEKRSNTPLGMALQGRAADATWERTAHNHAYIVPSSPRMLIPLGPMVAPFLRILSAKVKRKKEPKPP